MSKQDGGPAFPRPASEDRTSGTLPDGDRLVDEQAGMTLRDWFAGQALTAIVPNEGWVQDKAGRPAQEAAEQAYLVADAMLVERDKK